MSAVASAPSADKMLSETLNPPKGHKEQPKQKSGNWSHGPFVWPLTLAYRDPKHGPL